MSRYLRGRQRLAMGGAQAAVFLFACWLFGVLAVRDTTQGIMFVGAAFCLVVYWTKPHAMAWVALFLAFAALPVGFNYGKVVGPVTIYAYHLALVLAICYLIPIAKLELSAYLLPGVFLVTVVGVAIVGFVVGNAADRILREAQLLAEMVGGFVLVQVLVQADGVKGAMRAIAVIMWFSAGMEVASSLGAIALVGREEQLVGATGDSALRVITSTLTPAVAVLAALVAASVIGRVRPATMLAFGPPVLVVSLLGFGRSTLIAVGLAAAVGFLANFGWPGVGRLVRVAVIGTAAFAAAVPGSMLLLHGSKAGVWLGHQFMAFNQRVLGGVSSSALAVDSSTLARLAEIERLKRQIAQAPVFGHGLGYAYQPRSGRASSRDQYGTFTSTLYTTYSHNFYMWWLCKAGAVGMVAFAVFALVPVIGALRCASVPAKIAAAVSVGLLAVCVVEPAPEEPAKALTLGMALGAAWAFAGARRARQPVTGGQAEAVEALALPALPRTAP